MCGTGSRCHRRGVPAPSRRTAAPPGLAIARIIPWSPFSQRLHQHLGDLFGGQVVHPPCAGRGLSACCCSCIGVGSRRRARRGRFPRHRRRSCTRVPRRREVDLEHGLEARQWAWFFTRVAAQCVLEGLAILERDVLHRLHGVEVLGEADRQARVAELDDEAAEQMSSSPAGADRRWRRSRPTVVQGASKASGLAVPWPPWRCRSGT